jgi:hypothetical protein
MFIFLPSLFIFPAVSHSENLVNTAPHGYRLVTPLSANKEDAESMLKIVKSEIPLAEVKKIKKTMGYYRLVAGCFNDMASAVNVRALLSRKSIPSMIMQSKNKFSVIISSHVVEQFALDEQKQLAKKGINATIVKFNKSLQFWQINSVDSYELRDAVFAASLMTAKDVITTIE